MTCILPGASECNRTGDSPQHRICHHTHQARLWYFIPRCFFSTQLRCLKHPSQIFFCPERDRIPTYAVVSVKVELSSSDLRFFINQCSGSGFKSEFLVISDAFTIQDFRLIYPITLFLLICIYLAHLTSINLTIWSQHFQPFEFPTWASSLLSSVQPASRVVPSSTLF